MHTSHLSKSNNKSYKVGSCLINLPAGLPCLISSIVMQLGMTMWWGFLYVADRSCWYLNLLLSMRKEAAQLANQAGLQYMLLEKPVLVYHMYFYHNFSRWVNAVSNWIEGHLKLVKSPVYFFLQVFIMFWNLKSLFTFWWPSIWLFFIQERL